MNPDIQKMMEIVAQDKELQQKFSVIRDPDEAYALAVSIHGGYTKEELIETVKALREQVTANLDEKELADAAGGFPGPDVVIPYVTAGASVVGSITFITAITISV